MKFSQKENLKILSNAPLSSHYTSVSLNDHVKHCKRDVVMSTG